MDLHKNILYYILCKLSLPSLLNMAISCKKFAKIMDNDEFWQYKLSIDYPHHIKNNNISSKKLYIYSFFDDFKLYFDEREKDNISEIAKGVVTLYPSGFNIFYKNIYDELWIYGDNDGLDSYDGGITGYIKKLGVDTNVPYKVCENIKDYGGNFVLLTDGNLCKYQNYNRIFITPNVSKIYINEEDLCIKDDGKLYLIDHNNILLYIGDNVKNVRVGYFIKDIRRSSIYYTTNNGELWEAHPHFQINNIGDTNKYVYYKPNKIINTGVDDIVIVEKYLYIINTDRHIKIYSHKYGFSNNPNIEKIKVKRIYNDDTEIPNRYIYVFDYDNNVYEIEDFRNGTTKLISSNVYDYCETCIGTFYIKK